MRQFTQQDVIDIRTHFPLNDCLAAPDLEVAPQAAQAFDACLEAALQAGPAADIPYALPFPKYLFLDYLARTRGLVLHGSQHRDLSLLSPVRNSRDAREFGDQQAIYATQDPLWALFFAVLDRTNLLGPINNGAIQLQGDDGSFLRRYFFCLDAPSLKSNPWKPGAIYILPSQGFEPDPDQQGVHFGIYTLQVTHWIYRGEAQPLARLLVNPEDFPFLHQVWGYDGNALERRMEAESIAGWPFLDDPDLSPIRPKKTRVH